MSTVKSPINFANWIAKQHEHSWFRYNSKMGKWFYPNIPGKGHKTTRQLYNIYKKEMKNISQ